MCQHVLQMSSSVFQQMQPSSLLSKTAHTTAVDRSRTSTENPLHPTLCVVSLSITSRLADSQTLFMLTGLIDGIQQRAAGLYSSSSSSHTLFTAS